MKKINLVIILTAILIISLAFTIKFKDNALSKKLNVSMINNKDNIDDEEDIDGLKNNKDSEEIQVPDESSKVDRNGNGVPDPIDIVNEARKEADQKTVYKDAYYVGGYPPDGEGVCTDVIWRGFKAIGVNIKELIDKDIRNNLSSYKAVNGQPDPNIDFRRVLNQDVFFKRNAIELTNELIEDDINNLKEWQPGDIVVFVEAYQHVGIISDKRDYDGIPFVIHNNRPCASEAKLSWFPKQIHAHYRWKY